MKDILPFYTQDGSVGLYSKSENDIFHSVYGAYSEAYDKFILPANFEFFLKKQNHIKILDLCSGIGYNTKSFLNYFLENFSGKKIENKNIHARTNGEIYADNMDIAKSKCSIHGDNIYIPEPNLSIYTNNIFNNNTEKVLLKTQINNENNVNEIMSQLSSNDCNFENKNFEEPQLSLNSLEPNYCYSVQIDAVDINETLMKASVLFKNKGKYIFKKKTGIKTVDKYLSKKSPNLHKYKLKDEVNYIIGVSLVKQYGDKFFSKDILSLLNDIMYSEYIDKKMYAFMSFLKNDKYGFNQESDKLSFLHNIYYRYISKGYKNALKALKNNNILINYVGEDARAFLKDNKLMYDYIFLDAFSVSKTPNLWTYDFFTQLFNHLSINGMILTYSNSPAVRNAFLKNNFYVGKIFNKNENKYTGTIATKNPNLIEHNLSDYELGLINTNAGIMYRDVNLFDTNLDIIKRRNKELESSKLSSSSQYIKKYKEKL